MILANGKLRPDVRRVERAEQVKSSHGAEASKSSVASHRSASACMRSCDLTAMRNSRSISGRGLR